MIPEWAEQWEWPGKPPTESLLEMRRKLALCWHINCRGRTVVMRFYPNRGWVYETWPGMEIAG